MVRFGHRTFGQKRFESMGRKYGYYGDRTVPMTAAALLRAGRVPNAPTGGGRCLLLREAQPHLTKSNLEPVILQGSGFSAGR